MNDNHAMWVWDISCTKVWIIQKKAPNMKFGTKNKTTQNIRQKIH